MNGPERRLTPRKTAERFAYINIEPRNGGSVLNVSEGGLCFHSIAPIQRIETIRFWFREHDRRIEVQGHESILAHATISPPMGGNLMEWECFEDMKNKGDWRVEAIDFDNEGEVYVTIFSGRGSRKRAHEYAAIKKRSRKSPTSCSQAYFA